MSVKMCRIFRGNLIYIMVVDAMLVTVYVKRVLIVHMTVFQIS